MITEFQQLKGAIDPGKAFDEVKDPAFAGEDLSDEDALRIVVQDANAAEQFLQTKSLPTTWNTADDLYRARVTPDTWPNSQVQRSALPMPVVLEAIETLIPQTHMAFFSDAQPFLLDPKGKTKQECARCMAKLVSWAICETGFEEEIRKCLKSGFQYGTLVGKLGWKRVTKKTKVYSRSDDGKSIKAKVGETEISHPTFEYVDLRKLLVDPLTNCQDIQTAGFVIHQDFIVADQLEDLAAQGYDNVPTKAELKQILLSRATTTTDALQPSRQYSLRQYQSEVPANSTPADPLAKPLEILEHWSKSTGRVITVLQGCIVLRNEVDEDFEGNPFRSCSFIDVLNSFYGIGVATLLEGEQRFQTGVMNTGTDGLNLKLNPTWMRKKGFGAQSQNIVIGPGRVVNEEELAPLPVEDTFQIAMEAIGGSEARAARRVGANYGPEMPTQAMRTAEGVQAFTSGVQVKLQYFIENFANLVFIPAIEAFIELIKNKLDIDQVQQLLSDEDGKAYEGDIADIYNGRYSVDVLTSTKLSARRAIAQMLTPIMQFLGAPSVMESFSEQNKKFNYVAFFSNIGDITGWPLDNFVEDLTPEEKQERQANNPAVIKAQSDAQQQQQQFQNDMELEQQKGFVRAGNTIIKKAVDGPDAASAESAIEPATPLANQPPQQ